MKKVLLIIGLLFILLPGFAQKKEKLEALRVSFISKRLELSTTESERFWPVYNEYNDKLRAIKRNLKQSFRQYNDQSESGAEQLYQLFIQSQQAEADLHKSYGEKMKAIIGVRKVVKLRIAEEEFRKEMIENIRERSD